MEAIICHLPAERDRATKIWHCIDSGKQKLGGINLCKVQLDRMAAMLSRLGKRGYAVEEGPSNYAIDSDFDSDEMKSQPDAALSAHRTRKHTASE